TLHPNRNPTNVNENSYLSREKFISGGRHDKIAQCDQYNVISPPPDIPPLPLR
ncbi:hypothetical protein ACHAWX_007019, partial [Stephanocyclus meneghinianus]